MSKDTENYSKREIDMLFQHVGLTIKAHVDPIHEAIKGVNKTLEGIASQHKSFEEALDGQKGEITTMRSRSLGAMWAFGITVPLLLAVVVWVFFNQIENLKM